MGALIPQIEKIRYNEKGKIIHYEESVEKKVERKLECKEAISRQLVQRVPYTLKNFIKQCQALQNY